YLRQMAKKRSSPKKSELIVPKRLQHELGVFFARNTPRSTGLALRNLLMDYLVNGPGADMRVGKGLDIIWKLMRLMDKAQDMMPVRSMQKVHEISKAGNYFPEMDNDDLDDEYAM